jgi:predicted nucleic acid-binding protein
VIDGVLDTNILIDLLRNVTRTVQWYASLQTQNLALVPIVWMEVVQGSRSKIEQQQIIRFLNRFQIEHPTAADNLWAMRELANFNLSYGVHFSDVMIASTTVRLNVLLYTFNVKHFSALPNLNVQRPY